MSGLFFFVVFIPKLLSEKKNTPERSIQKRIPEALTAFLQGFLKVTHSTRILCCPDSCRALEIHTHLRSPSWKHSGKKSMVVLFSCRGTVETYIINQCIYKYTLSHPNYQHVHTHMCMHKGISKHSYNDLVKTPLKPINVNSIGALTQTCFKG